LNVSKMKRCSLQHVRRLREIVERRWAATTTHKSAANSLNKTSNRRIKYFVTMFTY
jgi:hypothetical protein